jgi:CxxC motif-containing protein (DUF1111 family)
MTDISSTLSRQGLRPGFNPQCCQRFHAMDSRLSMAISHWRNQKDTMRHLGIRGGIQWIL